MLYMSDFLVSIFDKRDKPISESSRKLYQRNLEKLNDEKPVTSLGFLTDVSKIMQTISKYKPTTQRSFIISICTVLKNNNEKLYQTYFEILSKMNSDLKVHVEKTEKQKDNWMGEDEITNIYSKLKKLVPKKIKSKEDYDAILNFMIMSLYVLQAPRRNIDYTLMKISSEMSDKKYNYLDLNNKKFIFNNYKTQGTYLSTVVDVPDDLMRVILMYVKVHPESKKLKNKKYNIHFLSTFYGENIEKSASMTNILNKIFDKKIGSSMLRNMYLTNKYGSMMKEMKGDVKSMATSVDTAMNNYIKQD
jgi:integrase